MKRRDFLKTVGAATLLPSGLSERQAASSVTVLYDGRAVNLKPGSPAPGDVAESLWIDQGDLFRINEFELKPEGACRADVCIPGPSTMLRGDQFHLPAFAR